MASLLGELQESGSRLEDGTPNAGGKCWFYQPGTIVSVNVYTDATATTVAAQPITLDSGGRIPTADYPDGIWLTQRVRLYVEDNGGGLVSDTTYTPADAGNSALSSEFFTGTTTKEALEALAFSAGGTNGNYLESGGATERSIHDKLSEIWISVKDFGAVGNGVAIDTTQIQTTMNRVAALGGGTVYFPPGTYRIDQALTLTGAGGVRIIGAGYGVTTVVSVSATANIFTLDTCPSSEISGITTSGTSTGKVVSADDCPSLLVRGLNIEDNTYAYGIDATGTTSVAVYDSFIRGATRSIRYNVNGTEGSSVYGTRLEGSVEYLGGAHDSGIIRSQFFSGSILLGAGLTGTRFTFVGATGAAAITVAALANDPLVYQEGCGLDQNSYAGASGSTLTPVVANGARNILLTATASAAGTVTVAIPAVPPDTFDASRIYVFRFRNALGGGSAVTWSLAAGYVLVGAVQPAGVDATTVTMGFIWDTTTSEFREMFRATTAT